MRYSLAAMLATATIFVATASMAAVTQVNIADPNATTRVAHVEPGNRLAVQEVEPTSFFHSTTVELTSAPGCVHLASAPSSKALIIAQVRANTYADPSPGTGQDVAFYADASCSPGALIGDITPPSVGLTTVTFGPGLTIPTGGTLSVEISGSLYVNFYLDGYTVAAAVAPAVSQTLQVHGSLTQHR